MVFQILLTLFFVFLNGFFVAAEFAIVKVRSSRIELRVRGGSGMAKIAKKLIDNLDAYLSATQLGITLASLGLGWIGESVVTEVIKETLLYFGFNIEPELLHKISLPIAFATITVLHIVLGELAPKSLAIQRSETVALSIALPLRAFYLVFKPIIWLLNSIANKLIKVFGIEPLSEEHELHSAEELKYLISESSKSGLIDTSEKKLLENVFEFAETPVKQIMVPHNKITGVEINFELDDILEIFIEEGYSRVPVYKETLDNILGVIYAKDLISMLLYKNIIILQDIIRPPYFVSEDDKINILLKKLQSEKIHMAIVMDEFGGTAGLVTLEDIIEEIVGEIQDEYDEESPDVVMMAENEYSVNASAAIDDANDFLPIPLPDSEDYETVGGMIMHRVGRIPNEMEEIELDDYLCTILKSTDRNIKLIKLVLIDNEGIVDDDEYIEED